MRLGAATNFTLAKTWDEEPGSVSGYSFFLTSLNQRSNCCDKRVTVTFFSPARFLVSLTSRDKSYNSQGFDSELRMIFHLPFRMACHVSRPCFQTQNRLSCGGGFLPDRAGRKSRPSKVMFFGSCPPAPRQVLAIRRDWKAFRGTCSLSILPASGKWLERESRLHRL